MGCCSRNNKLLTILETYSRNSHRYMHGHWTSINIVVNLINVSIIVNYTQIVKLLLRQQNYQYLMKSRTLLASALIRYWFKAILVMYHVSLRCFMCWYCDNTMHRWKLILGENWSYTSSISSSFLKILTKFKTLDYLVSQLN